MNIATRYPSVQIALFAALGLTGCTDSAKTIDSGADTQAVEEEEGLCSTPESLLDATGNPTGFERCADGTLNRAQSIVVTVDIPGDSCMGTEAELSCETDADCLATGVSRCLSQIYTAGYYEDTAGDPTFCGCTYSCASDADCGDGKACVAGDIAGYGVPYPVCVSSSCLTNDDCTSGECSLVVSEHGCGVDTYLTCRDEEVDDCRTDEDCADAEDGDKCIAGYNGADERAYVCDRVDCTDGRPLMVDGVARTAGGAFRDDWKEPVAVSVSGLNRKMRRALAKHWVGIAAMEHASVASFARFSLQLMALGAPPELLLETQAAGVDEVQHAKTTFGIASRYAGVDLGPGRLVMDGITLECGAVEVLRGLVREACVNETVGVAVALASAEAAVDPVLQAALRQIAADETRHSALAWKTLKWMLAARPELADVAAVAFEEGIAGLLDSAFDGPVGLDAHGVLSPERQREVYREAVETLIRPCAAQLLSGSSRLLAGGWVT